MRRHPHKRPVELGLTARQLGRHPTLRVNGNMGNRLLRSNGFGLRCARDQTTDAKKRIEEEQLGRRRAGYKLAELTRYNERSTVERVNGRLKDDFGAR
jgi:hypothetical protein